LGLEEYKKDYLTIKVGESHLELLPMGELPARKVMEMMSSKNQDKLQSSLELMKLAARSPSDFQTESEYISFNELILAIDMWMEQSSDHATKTRPKLEKKSTIGFGNKRRKSETKKLVDDIVADLESEDDTDKELASGIATAIVEAGIEDFDSMTEDEVVLIISKWFVKHKKAQLLIDNNLLTEKSRTGKYYPIKDGRVARRLGFTIDDEETTEGDTNE
jgi:hypothetical protein